MDAEQNPQSGSPGAHIFDRLYKDAATRQEKSILAQSGGSAQKSRLHKSYHSPQQVGSHHKRTQSP